jgi:putative addiction module component (TIGR02574 family)
MDFHSLSVKDRLRMIEAIWDSIAAEPGQPELTDAQRAELEWRWVDDEANPDDVIPWETVLGEARARSRR